MIEGQGRRSRRPPVVARRDEELLSQPRRPGTIANLYDPEAFGRFAEAIARTLGTARFLVIQTGFVAAWVALNVVAWRYRWDKYPFIALNLAFSTQAAYAAPLILLAQNRQDDRDRAQAEVDRDVNARTQADTEYLARELSSVRLTLADVVTADDLAQAVDRVAQALEDLGRRLDDLAPAVPGAARAPGGGGAEETGADPTTGSADPLAHDGSPT